jgi:phosphoribosylglycinamide formyltransferase 1
MSQHRLAVFASGSGSNARQIMTYFQAHPDISVAVLVCNKPGAGVLDIAREMDVPTLMIRRSEFYDTELLLGQLQAFRIDWIALAGFLWLVPEYLVRAYPNRIFNIHPALLPKYGGKGMYGHFVHEAVKAAGEKESGMTIHLVDEHYDRGKMLFQAACPLDAADTPDMIAQKVLALEHAHYARVIEQTIQHADASL